MIAFLQVQISQSEYPFIYYKGEGPAANTLPSISRDL